MAADPCRCGSGADLDQCCGPVLAGIRPAPTAEALMRSRFTAFAVGDVDHLRASWAPETCPAEVRMDPDRTWTGLEIIDTVDGRELATRGVVEFVAHYRADGAAGSLHERSNFRRERGRWVYVDGAASS